MWEDIQTSLTVEYLNVIKYIALSFIIHPIIEWGANRSLELMASRAIGKGEKVSFKSHNLGRFTPMPVSYSRKSFLISLALTALLHSLEIMTEFGFSSQLVTVTGDSVRRSVSVSEELIVRKKCYKPQEDDRFSYVRFTYSGEEVDGTATNLTQSECLNRFKHEKESASPSIDFPAVRSMVSNMRSRVTTTIEATSGVEWMDQMCDISLANESSFIHATMSFSPPEWFQVLEERIKVDDGWWNDQTTVEWSIPVVCVDGGTAILNYSGGEAVDTDLTEEAGSRKEMGIAKYTARDSSFRCIGSGNTVMKLCWRSPDEEDGKVSAIYLSNNGWDTPGMSHLHKIGSFPRPIREKSVYLGFTLINIMSPRLDLSKHGTERFEPYFLDYLTTFFFAMLSDNMLTFRGSRLEAIRDTKVVGSVTPLGVVAVLLLVATAISVVTVVASLGASGPKDERGKHLSIEFDPQYILSLWWRSQLKTPSCHMLKVPEVALRLSEEGDGYCHLNITGRSCDLAGHILLGSQKDVNELRADVKFITRLGLYPTDGHVCDLLRSYSDLITMSEWEELDELMKLIALGDIDEETGSTLVRALAISKLVEPEDHGTRQRIRRIVELFSALTEGGYLTVCVVTVIEYLLVITVNDDKGNVLEQRAIAELAGSGKQRLRQYSRNIS